MRCARSWLPRGCAAAGFVLYALAAPADFYWLDSAHLSAAGAGLGIAHPTGFPGYAIAAKAASFLPLADIAFRINVLSAAAAAAAVLFVGRLVCEICGDDRAAAVGSVAAGATLAVSLPFFRQATVAEVYAPTAAVLAASLLFFARVARGARPRDGLLLALTAAAGVALHTSYLWMGPPIAALLFLRLRRGARWPLLAPAVFVAAAGALYLYLPVRAVAGARPALIWDDTGSLGGLLRHLSGERIRAAFADRMYSTVADVVVANLSEVARQIGDHLLLALLAAIAGMLWLGGQRRTRWLLVPLAAVLVGDALYASWINPMGLEDLQTGIPFAVACCAAGGAGVSWLARSTGRVGPWAGSVAAVILVVSSAMVSWPVVWAATPGRYPRAWSEAALAKVAPRGVALAVNDSTAAGLLFLTTAEGARPDVSVLVQQHLWMAERAKRILDEAVVAGWPGAARRELAWELGPVAPPAGQALLPGAPLSRLVSGRGDPVYQPLAVERAAAEANEIFRDASDRDRPGNALHANALTQLAIYAHRRGDLRLAAALYDQVLREVRPVHVPALVNRAVIAAAQQNYEAALQLLEVALLLSPTHATALINAARYHMARGEWERASERIERALRIAPGRASAWIVAARLDRRAGDEQRAAQRYQRGRALDPGSPEVLSFPLERGSGRPDR